MISVESIIIMQRIITEQLIEWKNNPDRKPLVIKGARQIGKTWILKEFGRLHYEHVAYFKCDNDPAAKNLFKDYNISRIIKILEAVTKVPIIPGETLIVLDEIQEIQGGLHSLKYFCEDAPEYHVAVAGSLLGLLLHPGESFPVGKVDILEMYPMTFHEFLLAVNEPALLNFLKTKDWDSVSVLHDKYTDLLRLYYFVGGMPEAVKAYIDGKTLKTIRKIQLAILDAYSLDISKHAEKREAIRIQQVFRSIPMQLTKENKKFIFGAVKKGARANDFEIAIQWLVDAGIAIKIHRIKSGLPPLKFYEDMDAFKLYLLDCGLFGAMVETDASQVITGDNIFREYKGAFTEEFVLEQISTIHRNIYYFSKENSQVEVDFVFQQNGAVVPLEVKAEENVKAKSLKLFHSEFSITRSLRTSMCKFREEDWITNIPLYGIEEFCR